MSDDKAVVPVDQRTVSFYGDEITAVLVATDESEQVFVPIRPICDLLSIAWSSQRRRILRDPILSEVMRPVTVTVTGTGQQVDALSLPLPFLNGWLFGVNADRVNPDARERLLRYQRECYDVLARAFLERAESAVSSNVAALAQIRENALAIAEMASLQIEHEQRLATAENRLDRAAAFVGELGRRVRILEQRTAPGQPIGEEQAAEISQQVKALAMLLTEQDSSKNHYQSIFNELYRRFGVTSYKLIPQGRYAAVLVFLEEWRGTVTE